MCSKDRSLRQRWRRGVLRMRNRPSHLACGLVLSQPNIDHLTQQVLQRPGQIGDLDHQFGAHPVHAGEDQR
jgi:hypothetical protein